MPRPFLIRLNVCLLYVNKKYECLLVREYFHLPRETAQTNVQRDTGQQYRKPKCEERQPIPRS
jgi:hypothetical protein